MAEDKRYKNISRLFKVLSYIILLTVVVVFLVMYSSRKSEIKDMNYSYNNMMEAFPELNSVDMSVNGLFDSLDESTLSLEMYKSFFQSVVYSIPSVEGISEERIQSYWDELYEEPTVAWNKEVLNILSDARDTLKESESLYGKEYIFNMQKDFVLGDMIYLGGYLIVSLLAVVIIFVLLIRLAIFFIVSFYHIFTNKKKDNILKNIKRKINNKSSKVYTRIDRVPSLWTGIILITLVFIILPVFLVVRNVRIEDSTDVTNVVNSTINKLEGQDFVFFSKDKQIYLDKYRDSLWYDKRVSYELADYLLFKYKTTGDDSLLTEYFTDLSSLNRKLGNEVVSYIQKSKENIDSFVPAFDTLENTVATESMYDVFADIKYSFIFSDWYNFESSLPMMIYIYLSSISFIICFTGSRVYYSKYKEIEKC